MVRPGVDVIVSRIDGAVFQHYTEQGRVTWSVFRIPDSAVDRVQRLGGKPYLLPCGCPFTLVEDTGQHQEGCEYA